VRSEPGKGSCFWAELPLPAVPAPPLETQPGDAARLAGKRVLIVEDNPVNMTIAVAQLEQWGLQVEQAHDGNMAIEAVDRAALDGRPFDAVLMDVQMPFMSGNDAARALRQRYPTERLPIIALTAAALVSEREKAMGAGMNDFVTKPIDPAALRRALDKVLI